MCVCVFHWFQWIFSNSWKRWWSVAIELSLSLSLSSVCFLAHRLFNRGLLAAAQTNSLRNSPHIANAMGNAWDGPAVIASLRTNRVVGIHNYHVDLIVPASRFSWNRSTERSKRTKRNETKRKLQFFHSFTFFFCEKHRERHTKRMNGTG